MSFFASQMVKTSHSGRSLIAVATKCAQIFRRVCGCEGAWFFEVELGARGTLAFVLPKPPSNSPLITIATQNSEIFRRVCSSLHERTYVISFECMLRAAVGALVLRWGVDCATDGSRDVARALRVGAGCRGGSGGHPRWRGSRSVTGRSRELGPKLRKLISRQERDEFRCRHVWIFMRKRTFQLRDHLKRFVRKLKCQLRLARCCRTRALSPRKLGCSAGDLAFNFALGFVFDTGLKRHPFGTSRLGVTKELVGLCDVGDCESSIADRGRDLGKIFE